MQPEFQSVGISLEKFFIENGLHGPKTSRKKSLSTAVSINWNLDKLTKFKTAKAIEAAAANEGGHRPALEWEWEWASYSRSKWVV